MRADAGNNEGTSTVASGTNAHAEGTSTTASANASHAEGNTTIASAASSHAEGDSTKASGSYSHAEGRLTEANGIASHAEGISTLATGQYAHAEGNGTKAIGNFSHSEGAITEANGTASHSGGLYSSANRISEKAHAGGRFVAVGDAQASCMIQRLQTTTATSAPLSSAIDGAVLFTSPDISVLTLPVSRAFALKISTVARRTDVQGEMAMFTWEGLVGRDSTGNARIIGTPIQAAWGDAPATDAWAVSVGVNTTDATNNYVAVTATGEAAKTIRWVSKLEWVEVGG